jgi:hypothetical protein
MKNEVGVVVSRYYEDLKWIENLTSNIDVYVYNRSGDSPGMGVPHAVAWAKPKDENDVLGGLDIQKCKNNGINLQVIDIPDDPGYEASTYAYHCHSKYYELNDFTVFIQAHPEIYVKNIIEILNNPDQIKYTTYSKESLEQFSPAIPKIVDYKIAFEPFCDYLCTLYSDQDYQWSLYKEDFSKVPWLEFCKNMPGSVTLPDGKWFPPSSWWFGAGNQFVVSKDLVLKHDPDYYKKIQEFTNVYMDPNGDSRPNWQQLNQGPNIMEGIWRFIF